MQRLLKYVKGMKISHFLLLAGTAMVTCSLLLYFTFSYHTTTTVVRDKVDALNESTVEETDLYISGEMFELEQYLRNITADRQLAESLYRLEQTTYGSYEWLLLSRSILEQFLNFRHLHNQVYQTYIISPNNKINYATSSISDTDFLTYQQIIDCKVPERLEQSPYNLALFTEEQLVPNVGSYNFIGQIPLGNQIFGYLVVTMSPDWLRGLAGYDYQNVGIYDESNGQFYYEGNEQIQRAFHLIPSEQNLQPGEFYEQSVKMDGNSYQVTATKIRYREWYVISLRSNTDLFSPVGKIKLYAVFLLLVSFLLTIPLSKFITAKIATPLNNLEQSITANQGEKLSRLNVQDRVMSFRETIILYLLMVVMVPLLIYHMLFYFLSSNIIENTMSTMLERSVNHTVTNLDLFVERNSRISQNIMFHYEVQTYLTAPAEERNDRMARQVISANLDNMEGVECIKLYDTAGTCLISSSTDHASLQTFYRMTLEGTTGESCVFSRRDSYTQELTVSILRKINYVYKKSASETRRIGFIEIRYREGTLTEIYDTLPIQGARLSILDEQSGIVSQKITGSYEKSEDSIMAFSGDCVSVPWRFQVMIPQSYIEQDADKLFYMGFMVIFFLFMMTIVLACVISALFRRPIAKLVRVVNGLEEGRQVFFINELNELTSAFNDMLERVGQVVELEKENNKVELVALRSQINPHFLYNAFEQIKWMSDAGEKENVEYMINQLTQLFRIGINEQKIFIPVAEEIEYTKAYLNIQLLRYENSFTVHWEIEEKMLEYPVPKLILQPLVENAIAHGIRELEDANGTLSIYGNIQQDRLVFRVCDTGPGFTPERLAEVKEALQSREQVSRSIGLFNVNRRLTLYFHDQYQIQITSEPYRQTEIRISFPRSSQY